MAHHPLLRLVAASCTILLAAADICAGDASGRLAGRAADTTGGVLPGVTVEARTTEGRPQVVVTDAGGRYRFDALGPGRYRVWFRLPNFSTIVKPDVEIAAGGERQLDVVLLELPRAGTRQRAAVPEGSLLRRGRRLLVGRVGHHQLHERLGAPDPSPQRRRGGLGTNRGRRVAVGH